MTYNELLVDAIKYDEIKLAYSVYWMIKNGIVQGNHMASGVNWDLVNHEEVAALIEKNELGLQPIKLYTIPISKTKHFLVFAKNEQDAKGHCLNELKLIAPKVLDITDKINKSFWFPEQNQYLSLRELREETLVFPATAMIYEK